MQFLVCFQSFTETKLFASNLLCCSTFTLVLIDVIYRTNQCVTSFSRATACIACHSACLLYTSDAADEEDSVDLGGRRILETARDRAKGRLLLITNKKS